MKMDGTYLVKEKRNNFAAKKGLFTTVVCEKYFWIPIYKLTYFVLEVKICGSGYVMTNGKSEN
jgi:hypothetical protein